MRWLGAAAAACEVDAWKVAACRDLIAGVAEGQGVVRVVIAVHQLAHGVQINRLS